MIDREHALPLKRQAELAGISRGSVYYLARPVSTANLALMRVIDELHLEHPFAGQPHAARHAQGARLRYRAQARGHADARSLSGILCVRHTLTYRSMYAEQGTEQNEAEERQDCR
jgi:hypothetical protein